MSDVYTTLQNLFDLAFAVIPPRILMICLPFLSAVLIVKAVKSL